jgi:nucleotide-binding universal stress UspA family protein
VDKIIVGVDLSPASERAVAHAACVARRTGAEVLLVLAQDTQLDPAVPNASDWLELYATRARDGAQRQRAALDELYQRWSGQGAAVSTLVVDGFADEQLPRLASELAAGLIVVGTQGRTGLSRALLGSVAERVVRFAGRPVLVARGAAPVGGYHRIVVGTDFTATAELALGRAVEVAAPGARIDLVHCWQSSPWVPDDPPLVADDRMREAMLGDLAAAGEAAAARARGASGLDIRFQLVERQPAQGLADYADDNGADLIVVGSHGRRGFRRFLLGSVAEVTVRHAPCAVLVVR